jgi:hypothetical protein
MLVPFARTSSQRGPRLCAIAAGNPGQRWGARRRAGCSGIRKSASAPLRARWLTGDSARAWRLDGCFPWFRPRARMAHGGSASGWARNESRAIAVRVRSWSQRGAPRIPSWLQKPSGSIWPREATSVAAGVGDGGLVLAGRLASANGVERFRCRRRSLGPSVRGEPFDGGRRLGPWQPSFFTGRREKAVLANRRAAANAGRPVATEVSESRRHHRHVLPKRRAWWRCWLGEVGGVT